MLTSDIASAVGLIGGDKVICPFCKTSHSILIHPDVVVICKCCYIHTISDLRTGALVGAWESAGEMKERAEELYNDLPTMQ